MALAVPVSYCEPGLDCIALLSQLTGHLKRFVRCCSDSGKSLPVEASCWVQKNVLTTWRNCYMHGLKTSAWIAEKAQIIQSMFVLHCCYLHPCHISVSLIVTSLHSVVILAVNKATNLVQRHCFNNCFDNPLSNGA